MQKGEADLKNALVGKKVKKDVIVKANALIKLSMENSNLAKSKLVDLTQRKEKIKEKLDKKKKKK